MNEKNIVKGYEVKGYKVKGYKVFNNDWTCRGFQYTCPGTFKEDVVPLVCRRGFHFCTNAVDCFGYYRFDPDNKVAEVVAIGDVNSNGTKSCTNKIQIIREVSWAELLEIVNVGKGCSGLCNNGHRNSGNYNDGNYNSGNYNSGNLNSGYYNSGNWNSGGHNGGYWNSGNYNSGDLNSGYHNSGDLNSGYHNSGGGNSGNYNSGNLNSGNYNSGNWNSGGGNSGNYNSGSHNSGDWNSGNHNSGNHNSGDWNKTSFSAGYFCTEEPKILLFNKPSNWTRRDWITSKAYDILDSLQTSNNALEYVFYSDMTEQEKIDHPEAKITGGYLKNLDKQEYGQIWWNCLSDYKKSVIKAIPNFDKAIFKEITGIDVDK